MGSEDEFVMQWFLIRQRLVAQLVCLVVQYVMVQKCNNKKRITYNMNSARERVREEVMYRITCSPRGRDIVRMGPETFLELCNMLQLPKAAVWRNTSLPNYQKMLALYGNDRATGDDGDTPSSMKKRQHSSLPAARSSPPPAENEVDQLLSQNNVCFQDFSVNLDNVEYEDLSHGAQSETSKRTRKSAANNERVNSDGALIVKQIQEVASAIREGNQVFRERYAPQISGEDTFKLIHESGCDEDKVADIYCFLMHDVSKLRTVIECPLQCASKLL